MYSCRRFLYLPRYEVTKLASAFLASGAAIALAFVFHALIWNILATPCNPLENDYLAVPFADDCIFAPWQEIFYSLPIYLWIAAAVFFCGGVWGMASVTRYFTEYGSSGTRRSNRGRTHGRRRKKICDSGRGSACERALLGCSLSRMFNAASLIVAN